MENIASVPDSTHIATPLGEMALDLSVISELQKHSVFVSIPRAHRGEHSVQIELPLLQEVLGSFRLVPIVVGQLDVPTMQKMAAILCDHIDEKTLVVASSDFTHYGRNFNYYPFREDVAANIRKLDMGAIDLIKQKKLTSLVDYIAETGATICGRHAIGVLLAMLPDDAQAYLLHYDTSGNKSDDYSSSVSYASIAFTGRWSPRKSATPVPASAALSDADKRQLLALARSALQHFLKTREPAEIEELGFQVTPAMQQVRGCFVTLHLNGQLRGCVGQIFPMRPLYREVMAQAVNSGVNDRRFVSVDQSEMADLEFEISALTPPEPVASANEIVIGKHGIVLEKAGRNAVFLPQVAVEQGWDLEQTLNHLARKAGFADSAWREDTSFSVFEAVVFGEGHE
jgi:AmmeMemoRadiSam system protein A/AmmeMemoRadiSam system protein B